MPPASGRKDGMQRAKNIKSVKTSIFPVTSRDTPTSATVAMPNFNTIPAEVTKTAVVISVLKAPFSTERILLLKPLR